MIDPPSHVPTRLRPDTGEALEIPVQFVEGYPHGSAVENGTQPAGRDEFVHLQLSDADPRSRNLGEEKSRAVHTKTVIACVEAGGREYG